MPAPVLLAALPHARIRQKHRRQTDRRHDLTRMGHCPRAAPCVGVVKQQFRATVANENARGVIAALNWRQRQFSRDVAAARAGTQTAARAGDDSLMPSLRQFGLRVE